MLNACVDLAGRSDGWRSSLLPLDDARSSSGLALTCGWLVAGRLTAGRAGWLALGVRARKIIARAVSPTPRTAESRGSLYIRSTYKFSQHHPKSDSHLCYIRPTLPLHFSPL